MPGHVGAFAFQPLLYVVRRLCDQLLENVPGNVLAQAESLGENGIAVGPLDHVQKAEIRETGAIVSGDGVHDFLIAARHQHIRDQLLDRFSFRDREQMGLALGADVGNQRVSLEPPGLLQDGAGDIDLIVKGELVDDIDRGIVEAGQPPCQLRARRDFNLVRQPPDDLAEGPYLVVTVAAGDHQIGRMPQRPHAAFGRSSRYRLVEIPEKGTYFAHHADLKSQQSRTNRPRHTPADAIFR